MEIPIPNPDIPISNLDKQEKSLEIPLQNLNKQVKYLEIPIQGLDKQVKRKEIPVGNLDKPIQSLEIPVRNRSIKEKRKETNKNYKISLINPFFPLKEQIWKVLFLYSKRPLSNVQYLHKFESRDFLSNILFKPSRNSGLLGSSSTPR
ncbi:hypothetical protein Ataiwa_26030 [Algoriphagus taiwanensis]|uniref:Uncharacterized protein n=1 Tax=Algoriphagus taiwanensis TaxID=1445656 RepID=A0ABQ6Q2F3_9BACT|nr:hypothetical protein Ataiwa_26030 [Algoriphagus taiwanensis]